MKERVQKIMSNAGFCSRRKAEQLISEGKVTVNGKKIKLGDKADDNDEIMIGNNLLQRQSRKIYMMLNKPEGYATTLHDPFEKKTIARLISVSERIYPIGRLDKNSRGLLILTNDGEFANRLMHPRYEVAKTYLARLDKEYETKYTPYVQQGIFLKDGKARADIVKMEKNLVKITLHEGKKHIVKRLLRKLGYTVTDLLRVSIGNLHLDIKAGKTRFLTKEEVENLMQLSKKP